jgi:DNA adenine methylase
MTQNGEGRLQSASSITNGSCQSHPFPPPEWKVQFQSPPLRPPLKWAGGKRWLLPEVRPLWNGNTHRRFVEPLCGGLAMTFGLMPERALLNDINPHLVNFYRWLKIGLQITEPMRNEKKLYYSQRERFNTLVSEGNVDSPRMAGLFYYLNRTGYNGLCRFNQSGGFNVPFGSYKRINYRKDFTVYRSAMTGWEFMNGDFEQVPLDPTDFVYADPPYDVEFTQYSKEGFSWDDQVRIAKWLSRHPGPAVISNQATDRIVNLYEGLGFTLRFLKAPRMISCDGDRTPAREVLAFRGV